MSAQDNHARQSWEKFLDPESLRTNLLACALYIVTWETLRSSVIDRVRDFFTLLSVESEAYNNILSRDKSPFRATLLWFREMGAIEEADLALVERLAEHRNEIAHELPKFIASIDRQVNLVMLRQMCKLIAKVDVWWVRNMDSPIDPETLEYIDVSDVPDSEIHSGHMLFLELLFRIAAGDEDEAAYFYRQFKELS